MRTFSETGRYSLTERGTVISTVSDTDNRDWLHKMLDTVVLIDGNPCTVKGIETFAKATIAIGDPIGLLVEKINGQEL